VSDEEDNQGAGSGSSPVEALMVTPSSGVRISVELDLRDWYPLQLAASLATKEGLLDVNPPAGAG
jgi:hypothetical protein